MYNETLRKITSLSLLTILLTSSAVFALPNAMPAAHAQVASHPNLFVSAENSQWNNYFAGPQVVQVIVTDPNINRLDQTYGEPVVTVNGKRLRMAQTTDGNWYAYFADRNQAEFASKTSSINGTGLNFGLFCGPSSTLVPKSGVDYTQTKGFTLARDVKAATNGFGAVNATSSIIPSGGSLTNICTTPTINPAVGGGAIIGGNFITIGPGTQRQTIVQGGLNFITNTTEHVIRQNKTLNTNGFNPTSTGFAASPLYTAIWPVIQLYDFSTFPTTVTVDYSKSGGDQIVTLTFDRIPSNLISVTPDRTTYPENAQVFLTMNDPQLNIDPTEEDSWTWGANATNSTLYYGAFTRNGAPDADGTHNLNQNTPAMQNLIGNLTNFMFNHNGKFTFNPTAQNVRIVDFAGNGKQVVKTGGFIPPGATAPFAGDPSRTITGGTTPNIGRSYTGNIGINSAPITFIETGGVNTGVFGNWDSSSKSNIVTLTPLEESKVLGGQSIRGQSATFRYNDISGSIVGGFAFGSLTQSIKNNTWASGVRAPVTLTDMDVNLNSKISEHLNVWDPNELRITTMKIGTPFTISQPSLVQGNGTGVETALIIPQGVCFTRIHPGQYNMTVLTAQSTTAFGNFNPAFAACNAYGIGTFAPVTISGNATAQSIGIDELFSSRAVFNFVNQTGSTTFQLKQNATIFVDLKTTMQTLLNSINNPISAAANKFRGFNFFNYDLRSFSTLNGANVTATGVNIFLINSTVAPVTSAGIASGAIIGGGPTTTFELTSNVGHSSLPVTYISIANNTSLQGFVNLNGTQSTLGGVANPDARTAMTNIFKVPAGNSIGLAFQLIYAKPNGISSHSGLVTINRGAPVVADFFSIGITGDGIQGNQRINNAIYRWELEETGGNTGVFTGTNQYLMLNQLNIFDPNTYSTLRTINHDVLFVAIQDMLQSEGRAPQATYLDLGADGVNTQISVQQDIPTHTGVVSFDSKTYKVADTVTITVRDQDLNTNNDLVVIYTAVRPINNLATSVAGATAAQDPATDTIGVRGVGEYSDGRAIGRLLDVQFGQQDIRWSNTFIAGSISTQNTGACFGGTTLADDNNTGTVGALATSLSASGFSLVETAAGSGIFTGTFQVPDHVCQGNGLTSGGVITNGLNMKVNYIDFRDESGKLIEVSDNAGIRGNTGTVKLDKAVYPVPFGALQSAGTGVITSPATAAFQITTASVTSLNGVFPVHRDISGTGLVNIADTLPTGTVLVHARVNDPDYSTASTGTSSIATGVWDSTGCPGFPCNGPVAFQISRHGQAVLLATAGGPKPTAGYGIGIVDLGGIALPAQNAATWNSVRELGPMFEISPGAGVFQANLPIEFSDGPRGSTTATCPSQDYFDSLNGTTGFFGATTHTTTTFNFLGTGLIAGSTTADRTASQSSAPDTQSAYSQGEFSRFIPPHNQAPIIGTNTNTGNYCVRQGDVLTVTYFDTANAAGKTDTVTDSATFDLRNGVLQSDKSVYIIGSDMILTLVEPDLNLDSQIAETVPLDLVEWDSHAFKGTMGPLNNPAQTANFDPKPTTFVETGKDTGIFQTVIKIPKQLGAGNTLLERGEQIHLEYTDWGPAGAKTVGANKQDIELTIYTSNFGATVELDQKVYTWTDRVYITVVAPDHNLDPNLIDVIGNNAENQVVVSTRGHSINYQLAETGVDTGIFTGYVILTGDTTIKGTGGVDGAGTQPTGVTGTTGAAGECTLSAPCGPTNGFLQAEDSDGVTVSFEFTRDQTVTGSALIRWNIGEIKWLQPSYPANGQGVLQIVDPDMNLNPKAIDKFDTNVWSDSDSGGIKLTMTETGQDTGIFQGTVYFTTNFQSSGNRLHVAEGDTVTGEYKDRTLPPPYTPADQLRLTATTFIGTVVPPLERAPASNPRIVDSFGNAITGAVKVGQQIQVTADLANGQARAQPFAYLVQIQDANGVTVSLSWITGTLTAGQSLNPAQSWTPSTAGTYTAQIFVWQSIDNPNALSQPLSTKITVQ